VSGLQDAKHVEQAIISAIKTSVASSWHFYFHIIINYVFV